MYRVLTYLELKTFPVLQLVHITAPIRAIFLRQRQAQMKNAELSTGTSKRPRVEASTIAPTTSDQPAAVDPTKEIHVDPIATVDPAADAKTNDPTVTPPFSLRAMMETFMTTQATHRQLIDELLIEVTALRVDFAKYRSTFPTPPPSNP